jgi:hypothetical protein
MRDMRNQPAGWYRDPVSPNRHRYWDGAVWGDCVGEELRSRSVNLVEVYAQTSGYDTAARFETVAACG